MIQYLTRDQLDEKRYNQCISSAANSRIYAYSWYLDIVCDDWNVLVKGNYHMVMPLPKRKKYGINYIYQAPWIQQLGIFSSSSIDASMIEEFIRAIPKKFKLIDIFFNAENRFTSKHMSVRYNYILQLNTDFNTIKSKYNKNRKRISKKDFNNITIDKNGSVNAFLSLYKELEKGYKTHKDSVEKLQKLLSSGNTNVHIWNVFKNKNVIAGLCWLEDSFRITYLVPLATTLAKKENIPTYIVNELIKEHSKKNLVLDFEGSMIAGVARFYRSFGAEKEEYFWYKRKVYRL